MGNMIWGGTVADEQACKGYVKVRGMKTKEGG